MRPDFHDAVKAQVRQQAELDRAFYVLKREGGHAHCYIRDDSGKDAGWWKWTPRIESAMRFVSHNEAMRFVSLSNDEYGCFNNGFVLSIVRVAQVEVVTTTWKEV